MSSCGVIYSPINFPPLVWLWDQGGCSSCASSRYSTLASVEHIKNIQRQHPSVQQRRVTKLETLVGVCLGWAPATTVRIKISLPAPAHTSSPLATEKIIVFATIRHLNLHAEAPRCQMKTVCLALYCVAVRFQPPLSCPSIHSLGSLGPRPQPTTTHLNK